MTTLPSPPPALTLLEWLEEFLRLRERERYRNVRGERVIARTHVADDPIGGCLVRELDEAAMRDWWERVCTARARSPSHVHTKTPDRPLSRRTVRNVLALVRSAVRHAVSAGLLRRDVTAGLAAPRSLGATTSLELEGVLESTEQARLLGELERRASTRDGARVLAMVRVALGAGLRRTELLELRWGDVVGLGGEAPHLIVRFGSRKRGPTKGGRPRRVPLFGIALEGLRAWGAWADPVAGAERDDAHRARGVDARGGVRIPGLAFARREHEPLILAVGSPLGGGLDAREQQAHARLRVGLPFRDRVEHEELRAKGVPGASRDALGLVKLVEEHAGVIDGGGKEGHGLAAREQRGAIDGVHGGEPTALVFPGRVKGSRLKEVPAKDLAAALRAIGVTRRVRWHDLRHSCATSLLEGAWGRAWSVAEVQQLLGHSSALTTERYIHARGSLLFRAAAEVRARAADAEHAPALPSSAKVPREAESDARLRQIKPASHSCACGLPLCRPTAVDAAPACADAVELRGIETSCSQASPPAHGTASKEGRSPMQTESEATVRHRRLLIDAVLTGTRVRVRYQGRGGVEAAAAGQVSSVDHVVAAVGDKGHRAFVPVEGIVEIAVDHNPKAGEAEGDKGGAR